MAFIEVGTGSVIKIDSGFRYSWSARDLVVRIESFYFQFIDQPTAVEYFDANDQPIFNNPRYIKNPSDNTSLINASNISHIKRIFDKKKATWRSLSEFTRSNGAKPYEFGVDVFVAMVRSTSERRANYMAYKKEVEVAPEELIRSILLKDQYGLSNVMALEATLKLGRHTKNGVEDAGEIEDDPHRALACLIVDTFYDEFSDAFSAINDLYDVNPWFVIETMVSPTTQRVTHEVIGDYRILEWEKANNVKHEESVSSVIKF